MTQPKRDLFLITGMPGTGKTTFGDTLAKNFGFAHFDFEDSATVNQCAPDPDRFIDDVLRTKNSVVVTWGFVPDHEYSVAIVRKFRERGFKLIWFDGNREVALRIFQKRGTVPDALFQLQMRRIDDSRIIDRIKPAIINPFDDDECFKPAASLLGEIRRI